MVALSARAPQALAFDKLCLRSIKQWSNQSCVRAVVRGQSGCDAKAVSGPSAPKFASSNDFADGFGHRSRVDSQELNECSLAGCSSAGEATLPGGLAQNIVTIARARRFRLRIPDCAP